MTLRLTPDVLEACYEFWRTLPPFKVWNLPHADEVEFVVSRHPTHSGYHRGRRRDIHSHEIGISEVCVGHIDTLNRAVAHEMIHQYQQRAGTETANTEHNAEFKRIARHVCRVHGFDARAF